jgi:hypothetical protein
VKVTGQDLSQLLLAYIILFFYCLKEADDHTSTYEQQLYFLILPTKGLQNRKIDIR